MRGSRRCLAASRPASRLWASAERARLLPSPFPIRRRLSLGLRGAGAGKVPSRWRGSGAVASLRAAAPAPSGRPRMDPNPFPPRQPPTPTPEFRSDSRSSPCGRAEMSDLERVLCERTGSTKTNVLVGNVGTSRRGRRWDLGTSHGGCATHSFCSAGLRREWCLEISWCACFGSFASVPSASGVAG